MLKVYTYEASGEQSIREFDANRTQFSITRIVITTPTGFTRAQKVCNTGYDRLLLHEHFYCFCRLSHPDVSLCTVNPAK